MREKTFDLHCDNFISFLDSKFNIVNEKTKEMWFSDGSSDEIKANMLLDYLDRYSHKRRKSVKITYNIIKFEKIKYCVENIFFKIEREIELSNLSRLVKINKLKRKINGSNLAN